MKPFQMFIIGFVVISTFFPLAAQHDWEKGNHLKIFNFTPLDYNAFSQNWDVTIDSRDVLFFANNGGVLEFDGISWRYHSVEDNAVFSVAAAPDGKIYVGSDNEFGYLAPDAKGRMQYSSLTPFLKSHRRNIGKIWFTFISSRGIYFIGTNNNIYLWNGRSMKSWLLNNRIYTAYFVRDSLYIQLYGMGLTVLRDGQLVMLPGGEKFKQFPIRSMLPFQQKDILFIYGTEGIFHLKYQSSHPNIKIIRHFDQSDNFIKEHPINSATHVSGNTYAFGTYGAGVMIYDLDKDNFDFINFSMGLQDGIVNAMTVDSFGNLWMCLNKGISMTPVQSAVTHFGPSDGLRETVEDIERYNDSLVLATHQGCLYLTRYQTNPEIPWEINNPLYTRKGFLPMGNSQFGAFALSHFHLRNKKYLLAASIKGLVQYDNKFKPQMVTYSPLWDIYQSKKNSNRLVVAREGEVETLLYINNHWVPEGSIPDIHNDCRAVTEDDDGNIWIGTNNDGILYKLTIAGEKDKRQVLVRKYDELDGIPSGAVYPCNTPQGLLLGTSKGLFCYSDQNDTIFPAPFLNDNFHNNKRLIHRIKYDSTGKIWLSTVFNETMKNETGYLELSNNEKYRWVFKPFLCFSGNIIHAIYNDPDGITWLGGPNGLYRYDPSVKQNYKDIYRTLIRNVTIGNDSTLFYDIFPQSDTKSNYLFLRTYKPTLPYRFNSIAFKYSAPLLEKGSKPEFSYFLEGYDDGWSTWSSICRQGYTNLEEGNYIFHVRSRNIFNHLSEEASFAFTILPPWYHTWWAYLLFIFTGGLIMFIFIFFYTSHLRLIIRQRTSEIREQKEEIEKKNKDILDSIQYARRIQSALLTPQEEMKEISPEHFVLYMPRDIVSGDFYWLHKINSDILVAAADCTGHGVPGALMSMLGIAFLSEIINESSNLSPALILDKLRKKVIRSLRQRGNFGESQDGIDMSLYKISTKNNFLEFAGANLPLIIIRNNAIIEIKPDKIPIGISRKTDTPFTNHKIELQKGDLIYSFSDGYYDQFGGPKNKKFMIKRFRMLLLEIHSMPISQQKNILYKTIKKWIGSEQQTDDILVIGLKF